MTRYQKLASKAIEKHLREQSDQPAIPLFILSYVADRIAREAGKVNDLFESLFSYERLLPPGCVCRWIEESGMYSVVNPYSSAPCPRSYQPVPGVFDVAVDV